MKQFLIEFHFVHLIEGLQIMKLFAVKDLT